MWKVDEIMVKEQIGQETEKAFEAKEIEVLS